MDKKYKQLGLTVGKSVLLLFLTITITEISYLIFFGFMKILGKIYFSASILGLWKMGFFLLTFQSLVLSLHRHEKEACERFLQLPSGNRLSTQLKFIASSSNIYTEMACTVILSLILPSSFAYDFVVTCFFHNVTLTAFQAKLYTLLIILPLLILMDVIARIRIVRKYKRQEIKKPKQKKSIDRLPPTLKSVLLVVLVYWSTALMLPWFFPVFDTIWLLGGKELYFAIFGVLLLFFLIIFAKHIIRAVREYCTFTKKLKSLCEENQISITELKNPLFSFLFSNSDFHFTITKGEKKYDLKLIAGVFQNAPMIFLGDGMGLRKFPIRILRTEFFQLTTNFEYAFDSENKKILIVLPSPRAILVSAQDPCPTLTSAGKRVGDYTIYTPNIFWGALERDCL